MVKQGGNDMEFVKSNTTGDITFNAPIGGSGITNITINDDKILTRHISNGAITNDKVGMGIDIKKTNLSVNNTLIYSTNGQISVNENRFIFNDVENQTINGNINIIKNVDISGITKIDNDLIVKDSLQITSGIIKLDTNDVGYVLMGDGNNMRPRLIEGDINMVNSIKQV